jgi:AraC-like DNA-binding protein
MWRPPGHSRLLMMHGTTSAYAVQPDGEYIIGLVLRGGLRAQRGRERHILRPGDLCVWDPSRAHHGSPYVTREWEARLMVLELADLEAIVADPESAMPDLEFPRPRIADRRLARRFLALHMAMEHPAGALERETLVSALLRELAEGAARTERAPARSDPAPARSDRALSRAARTDPALTRACEFLSDNIARNVTLDELAAAAGVSRFRVVRLFTTGLGVPPHRFQIAQRVKLARRLLERGASIGETAARTGFVDQSHLHRHFRRSLGTTPGEYAARLRKNVQDGGGERQ